MSDKQTMHVIVDFQYNYYRHKFQIESGKIRRMSCTVNGEEIDTTGAYLTLKDIEDYRKVWEDLGFEVTLSVCFDSKSERKEEDKEYKSNRNKLTSYDVESVDLAQKILTDAGYNIYKEHGKEADDLVYGLVAKYKDNFDITLIYTVDADLLVSLDANVGVCRYKSSLRKHVMIKPNNFSKIMGDEYKCRMPYNTILLYKCLCGDKSDKIKGVHGFGPSSYNKFLDVIDNYNAASMEKNDGIKDESYIDYQELTDYHKVENILDRFSDYLGEKAVAEAKECLGLILPRETEATDVKPIKRDSIETRQNAYLPYLMKSLIK